MNRIAGRLDLSDVMRHLANRRPIFHSEADFQFAFAQALADLDPSIEIRLEVPQRATRRTYVDLACRADSLSLIEFKYVTRAWTGTDGRTEEVFDLRGHEALDLARLYFIHDATRLEGWVTEQPNTSGFAILLTNDHRLWEPPVHSRATRDQHFRLHEGREISGTLTWGTEESPYAANERTLDGTYAANWNDYSQPDTRTGGNLRWLGWSITA